MPVLSEQLRGAGAEAGADAGSAEDRAGGGGRRDRRHHRRDAALPEAQSQGGGAGGRHGAQVLPGPLRLIPVCQRNSSAGKQA